MYAHKNVGDKGKTFFPKQFHFHDNEITNKSFNMTLCNKVRGVEVLAGTSEVVMSSMFLRESCGVTKMGGAAP